MTLRADDGSSWAFRPSWLGFVSISYLKILSGVALIKKLRITDVEQNAQSGTQTKAEFLLDLDDVTLKKRAAPQRTEVARPAAPANWDALSAQVLPQLVERSWDVARYIQSAKCTVDASYTVPGQLPLTAKLSYAWEDGDNNGIISEAEVTIETVEVSSPLMRLRIKDVHDVLVQFTIGSGFGSYFQRSATAQKTAEGYSVTLKTKVGEEPPVQLTVSRDFRVIRLETESSAGGEVVCTYNHAKVRDKWLLTGFTVATPAAAAGWFSTSDRWTLKHDWQDGVPLVAQADIVSTTTSAAGAFQSRQGFVMRDWEVVERAAPFDYQVGGTPAVEPSFEWLREPTP